MAEPWHPNALEPDDIDGLADWQLLLAACHFGPTMGDCVVENYGYSRGPVAFICHDGRDAINLGDGIDLAEPTKALARYAGFDWRAWAKARIREAVEERADG